MPINEFAGQRRSNLTKEQKREAEAAIYGLPARNDDMPNQQQLSPEEIERMRGILAQHDAQKDHETIREFDLNNPPKQPYVFREFPKMVYHHEQRKHTVVQSAKEEKIAREAGYVPEPFPPAPAEEDDAEEIARLDKVARKPRQAKAE